MSARAEVAGRCNENERWTAIPVVRRRVSGVSGIVSVHATVQLSARLVEAVVRRWRLGMMSSGTP